MQKAQSPPAKTARERAYIAALSDFYRPGKQEFPERVQAYSDAMGKLYAQYPDDVDAGAFYALSLLAAEPPNDTSLTAEHKAMAVLTPLFAKYPDNPGRGPLHHSLLRQSRDGSRRAGRRRSLWRDCAIRRARLSTCPDTSMPAWACGRRTSRSHLGSVAAAKAAQAKYGSGIMDEPHAYDFLLYAYMQSGQDDRAKWVLDQTAARCWTRSASMPAMSGRTHGGDGPVLSQQVCRSSTRWKCGTGRRQRRLSRRPARLPRWRRWPYGRAPSPMGICASRQRRSADLARYDALMDEVKKGKDSYMADDTGAKIERRRDSGLGSLCRGQTG